MSEENMGNSDVYSEIRNCRICSSTNLIDIMSLGSQRLISFPDTFNKDFIIAPLNIVLCARCHLLQLKHTVDRSLLYSEYWYKSGISSTMVLALKDIVTHVESLLDLKAGDIVLDIGSNDGTLLSLYSESKLIKVGFEPSNIAKMATNDSYVLIHDYFSKEKFMQRVKGEKAKVITSIAMFYDLDDPNEFVEDVKECLHLNGVWVIQMNYLPLMLKNNTFDNISHEHLEYYSLETLEYLLRQHDLRAFDIELNDVNGGSIRIYVKHAASAIELNLDSEKRLQTIRFDESKMRIGELSTYEDFSLRVRKARDDLVSFLKALNDEGKTIFIYGASTRGLVVVEYAKIAGTFINYVVDKNPDKWGRYYAGTPIKVISIESYRKSPPDYLLVLPYQFINEIAEQEKEQIKRGMKLVTVIPYLKVRQ